MGMPTVIVRYRGGTRRTYRAVLIPYGRVSAPDAERPPEIVRRAREVLPNWSLRPVAYRVEAEGELWRVVEATGQGAATSPAGRGSGPS
jgi:hypothetical protein